ncbi:MAG: SEC-C metal-binding domain-containing protein [Opitutaceae bacterium]|nr:SEC-C metal-binding domain-containing protein [Opitutaceae bacterium]
MSDEDSDGEKAAMAIADEWYEAFARSPAFARLTELQQRKAVAITEFFARYTYTHVGLSPREWDRSAVIECCTEILPRKISAEADFFAATAPVLSAFLAFLGEKGHLPNGRELSELVAELEDEIVARAEDRGNWGPSKTFVMAALDAGVDLKDEAAMNAFMLRYNMQLAARIPPARAAREPPSFAGWPKPAQKSAPAAGPYDPCPCGSGRKYKFCCKGKR